MGVNITPIIMGLDTCYVVKEALFVIDSEQLHPINNF